MREGGLDRHEARVAAVHRQLGAARESLRVRRRVDTPCLEGRDLGEIEDVEHVYARAGNFEAAEPVDGEVAERMRRCGDGQYERRNDSRDEDAPSHAANRLATGAQRIEKCGFSARARRNHCFASSPWPRQSSIMPRWKSFVASRVPSRNARSA